MSGIRDGMHGCARSSGRLAGLARRLALARHPDVIARLVREWLREVAR